MSEDFIGDVERQPEIITDNPNVVLRGLTVDNVSEYCQLLDKNRQHLSKHGDYEKEKTASFEDMRNDLNQPVDENARFGVWCNDQLVGRVDLTKKHPGRFSLGYWIGQEFTGHGYVTAACRALIDYGREHLGATDIYAGVTKGNDASVAVLTRLGLKPVKDMGTYIRFHKSLSGHTKVD